MLVQAITYDIRGEVIETRTFDTDSAEFIGLEPEERQEVLTGLGLYCVSWRGTMTEITLAEAPTKLWGWPRAVVQKSTQTGE